MEHRCCVVEVTLELSEVLHRRGHNTVVGAPEVKLHLRVNLVVGRQFGSVCLPAVDEEGRNLLRLRSSCEGLLGGWLLGWVRQ